MNVVFESTGNLEHYRSLKNRLHIGPAIEQGIADFIEQTINACEGKYTPVDESALQKAVASVLTTAWKELFTR